MSPGLTLKILRSAKCSVFFVLCGCQEKTASFAPYCIRRLIYITKPENVYCAVRTASLNAFNYFSSSFRPWKVN